MTYFSPETVEELAETIGFAAAANETVEVIGNATKRGMGRPVNAAHTLAMAKSSGVLLYEPEELVLSARAGTPLSEIENLLAANHQQLAFEPRIMENKQLGA